MSRKTIAVDESVTVKELFAKAEVDITNASLSVNGDPIPGVQHNCTLASLGVQDNDLFIAVIKTNNA